MVAEKKWKKNKINGKEKRTNGKKQNENKNNIRKWSIQTKNWHNKFKQIFNTLFKLNNLIGWLGLPVWLRFYCIFKLSKLLGNFTKNNVFDWFVNDHATAFFKFK